MLKDTKEIPMRHLIMTIFNSRKSGRHPGIKWIFIVIIIIPPLTLLGLGLTLVHIQEVCQGILQVSQKQR